MHEHKRENRRERSENAEPAERFRVAEVKEGIALSPDEKVHGEVAAADRHKDDGHEVDSRIVEVPEARVVRTDAREAHRRHHVHHRVVPFHAGEVVGDGADDRKAEIDEVERARRLSDAWCEARLLERPAHFRLHDLCAANAQERQDRD